MPFMYCNHSGCNETVKLPEQYCAKHQPLKVPDPLPTKESTDKVVIKTKKTTK